MASLGRHRLDSLTLMVSPKSPRPDGLVRMASLGILAKMASSGRSRRDSLARMVSPGGPHLEGLARNGLGNDLNGTGKMTFTSLCQHRTRERVLNTENYVMMNDFCGRSMRIAYSMSCEIEYYN
ncbi:hypothetical protein Pfo_000594 [Paulownia fortunei]|nr:hypothetical protein Pfo_000594 [Paulownia fortunei]